MSAGPLRNAPLAAATPGRVAGFPNVRVRKDVQLRTGIPHIAPDAAQVARERPAAMRDVQPCRGTSRREDGRLPCSRGERGCPA